MRTTDVIDTALGVVPGSRLDQVRRARPDARTNAQLSYEAIFQPTVEGALSVPERFAIALLVTRWHGDSPLAAHYEQAFRALEGRSELAEALDRIGEAGRTKGPFGRYREVGLTGESTEGSRYVVPAEDRRVIGSELAVLVEHAHLLIFRPREASPDALQRVLDEGWTATEVVAVSQLVAFMAFQLRLAHGLSVLRSTWKDEN